MTWKNLPSPLPHHLDVIHARAAWDHGYTGSWDVRVALFDSGVDSREGYARVHLNRKSEPRRILLGGDFTGSSELRPYVDEFGHGTKMAGIIAAVPGHDGVVGLVPRVRIHNFKVADRYGMVSSEALLAAFDAFFRQRDDLRFHVALFALDAEVWQKDENKTGAILESFGRLNGADVLSVVAAAPAKAKPDPKTSATHPALLDLDTMLVVGALEQDEDSTADQDRPVDLKAPGKDVFTVSPMAPVPASGSSAAAALVAGAAALLFGKDPEQRASAVRNRLLELASETGNGRALDLGPLGQAA